MKFKDVTKENIELVSRVEKGPLAGQKVKVYDCKDTRVVFSTDGENKHISISNINRPVRMSEIDYAVRKIMKAYGETLLVKEGVRGIIHIRLVKEKAPLH
ncbi:DUF1827 family protein [Cytobacillus sp. Bac17]|uniref:DUF1827 family protein n=1 Tax=Cytobacillus sp. Bac17 TaxID=2926008 RepID=UPI002118874E|nr:DUF1827 family protein [Cytobacillus sp. Bac17]